MFFDVKSVLITVRLDKTIYFFLKKLHHEKNSNKHSQITISLHQTITFHFQ